MAVIQEFSVEGFPELFAAMEDMKEEIGKGKTDKIWRTAMTAAFAPVLQSAKAKAPKDTGQLSQRIYMKVHRPNSSDKKSKYYEPGEIYMARVSASPLRDESMLHVILNKRGKFQNVWKNKRPVAISQEFGNASTPQHPFLRPALESNINNVLGILSESLQLAIEEVARKAARAKAGV
jgi:HK97 gp10 family phage protein